MKDFISRTLSETIKIASTDEHPREFTVTRSRTSSGFAAITLDYGDKRVLELSSDRLEDYQGAARAIAEALRKVADEPCTLPVVP